MAGKNTITAVFTENDNFLEGVRFHAEGTAALVPEPETNSLKVAGPGMVAFSVARR
ncbi:MAG: hypothetical protein ABI794_02765 [Betaproteobacteria bacterium]